jgi:hypothetical protein
MNINYNKVYIILLLLFIFYCSNDNDNINLSRDLKGFVQDKIISNEEYNLIKKKYGRKFKSEEELIEQIWQYSGKTFIEKLKPSKIKFFIDTSGSMFGYIQGRTKLEDELGKMYIQIQKIIPEDSIDFYPAHNFNTPYKIGNKTQFFYELEPLKGIFSYPSLTSNMYDLFENILKNSNFSNNEISIFISDLLFDVYTNDVKVELEKYEALIDKVFYNKKSEENFDLFLLRLEVPFNGVYYNSLKQSIFLYQVKRPIFIVFLGKHNILINFLNRLNFNEFSQITHYIYLTDEKFKNHYIIKVLKSTNLENLKLEEESSKQSIMSFKHSNKGELGLSFVLKFRKLPFLKQDKIFTNIHNYKVEPENIKDSISILPFNKDKINPMDWKILLKQEEYDYQFTINLSDNIPSKLVIHFPLNFTTWVEKYSTNDDSNIKEQLEKTFSLEKLIKGILKNYRLYEENDIKYTIIIRKN